MESLLAAEDRPTQARAIPFILEDAGFQVEVATGGIDALKATRDRATPDPIATHLQMPNRDGLALAEAVAARAPGAGAPIDIPNRDLVPPVGDVPDVVAMVDRSRVLRSMIASRYHFDLESDPELISPLVRHVEGRLAKVGFGGPSDILCVGLALREALVNAIERGNLELVSGLHGPGRRDDRESILSRRGHPPYRDRRVSVDVRLSASEATFIVKDDGPGFNVSALPGLSDDELTRDRARGLRLIRRFMDRVEHNASGNEITMSKLHGAAANPAGV